MLRALFSLFLALSAASSAAFTTSELAQKGIESVVEILVKGEDGKDFQAGSGFYISPNIVVTNQHVARHEMVGIRRLKDGAKGAITKVLYHDTASDVAVLSVSLAGPPLELSTNFNPVVGSKVFAVGNPLGLVGSFSDGLVSGVRLDGSQLNFQNTATIAPGSSGGVLLNEQGEVLGITSSGYSIANIQFAVSTAHIWAAMDQLSLSDRKFGQTMAGYPTFPAVCSSSLDLAPLENVWTKKLPGELPPVSPDNKIQFGLNFEDENGRFEVLVTSQRLHPRLVEVLTLSDYQKLMQEEVGSSNQLKPDTDSLSDGVIFNSSLKKLSGDNYQWSWLFLASRFCQVRMEVKYHGRESASFTHNSTLNDLISQVRKEIGTHYPNASDLFAKRSVLALARIFRSQKDPAQEASVETTPTVAVNTPSPASKVVPKTEWTAPKEETRKPASTTTESPKNPYDLVWKVLALAGLGVVSYFSLSRIFSRKRKASTRA